MTTTPRASRLGPLSPHEHEEQTISPPNAPNNKRQTDGAGFRFGARAVMLLQELQKSDWVPAYDGKGVQQVIAECLDLEQRMEELETDVGEEYLETDSVRTALKIYLFALARNKRCLLSYHQYRWERIRSALWQQNGVLTHVMMQKLSKEEAHLVAEYRALITTYQSRWNLLLFSDLQPPKDLFIEVRVMQGHGEIFTESGVVTLQQGSNLYVKRKDVEGLIYQGDLKQL